MAGHWGRRPPRRSRGGAAGGTAGHVYPGLALAHTLRDRGHVVAFIGTGAHVTATTGSIDLEAIE